MTYAVDAAVAVALANTLFFAAATAESRTNVALYLAITVAPVRRRRAGDRAAARPRSSAGGARRSRVIVRRPRRARGGDGVPATTPGCSTRPRSGRMVLSKSFVVLKAAVTPRVLPEAITLVTTNSRLTDVRPGRGRRCSAGSPRASRRLWGSPGALFYTALLAVAGAVLCLRIPAWVEVDRGRGARGPARHPSGRRRTPRAARVGRALWRCGATAPSAC